MFVDAAEVKFGSLEVWN